MIERLRSWGWVVSGRLIPGLARRRRARMTEMINPCSHWHDLVPPLHPVHVEGTLIGFEQYEGVTVEEAIRRINRLSHPAFGQMTAEQKRMNQRWTEKR